MATPFRLKRSAVAGKRPILADLEKGELAFNFYDGSLYAERDGDGDVLGGVGVATAIANLTPWSELVGKGEIQYSGIVSATDYFGSQIHISGIGTFKDRVIFDSTNSIQIPVGTTAQRDAVGTAVTGQIRYNKTTSSFEGFGTGNSWGSLGGIKDVDQDTYITAESVAGADEDRLTFYTGGSERFVMTAAGHVGIGTTTPALASDTNNTKILNVGVVTANTYHGDQIIGTPTGGSFRAGAYTPKVLDKTKDSIDELNYILGKLVPAAPDTIDGVATDLTNDTQYYLCAGFTPTNNTGDAAPNQTGATSYVRNTSSTVTTDWLTQYGPGDTGTVRGFINAVGVGTTTMNVSFGLYAAGSNNGTYDKLVIANNKDAYQSTRNTGITSLFYEVYDVRLLNAVSPDGYNKAYFTHGSATTGSTYWYEDPSTVGAPDVTYSSVTVPSSSSHNVAYSSGVPHYTNNSANTFSYVISVVNATGDMFYSNNYRLLWAEGATTGFTKPDSYKHFNEFTGGTHPPARNYAVGSAVTCLATHTPNNVHATITSGHFHGWDCYTPYGSDLNEEATISEAVNIMGTSADYTNNVDEDAIECTVGSLSGGSATRVNAGATGDTPAHDDSAWNASATPAVYEAIVRGGDLRHDVTNYSTGYLPVGPNFSSGRSGAQYFQCKFEVAAISEFQISYTGSCAGCWVQMPDNSTWQTSLSGTNGWADMFQAYRGAGVPTTAEPGCSSGGLMDNNGGTFTCVFGTESSSNDDNERILVRFKLTSGQSISDISFSDT